MKNYSIFKTINSEISAYLYGFILGDGCITIRKKRKEYCLSISQAIEDRYIIDLFKEAMNDELNIHETKNKTFTCPKTGKIYKCQNQVSIQFYSKQLIEDLIKNGLCENKTEEELSIPEMNEELFRHFLRGYFDADGTCGTYLIVGHTKGVRDRVKPTFHISSHKQNILNEINIKLEKLYNIKIPVYKTKDRDSVLKSGSISEIRKLFIFMYENSNFYIPRKYEKFKNVMLTSSEFKKLKELEPRNA